jgi:isopenicillin-N epimerase
MLVFIWQRIGLKIILIINYFHMTVTTQDSWTKVRQQFNLTDEYIHLGAAQFLSSHPKMVRNAIEKWRKELDENPVLVVQEHENARMQDVRKAAGKYLNAEPDDIALTDSTTMGLGILYNGLDIKEGQEILTTKHDHYSHREAIHLASSRKKVKVKEVEMYKDLKQVTEDGLVESICNNIRDNTRVVSVTWVHSGTGLKIPVGRIGSRIEEINKKRGKDDRILFCVDGVHGFGIEMDTMKELKCDFFISGTHKWLYGPRGTGLICARHKLWEYVLPVIPDFSEVMEREVEDAPRPSKMNGKQATPGGFHSLEHRWATKEAFEFHEQLGKQRIADRIHELNRYCKEGLASMKHVNLITPLSGELSSGIVCFDVQGYSTKKTVEKLLKHRIIATEAPYKPTCTRFTPGIYNTPEEIDIALQVIASLK